MEEKINKILRRFPYIKKIVKRIYQITMVNYYKTKGKIVNFKPLNLDKDKNYFFGYYDKTPWNYNDKKMIFLRTESKCKKAESNEEAEVILYDVKTEKEKVIGITNAWNVQQGCMLQWLESEKYKIIYNKYINNKYKAIIYDIKKGKEKIIDYPIYSVAKNGKFALNLDFTRLHYLRPGYGYCNDSKKTILSNDMNEYAINYIDLKNNTKKGLLTYDDIIRFKKDNTMINATHKVNHIMISPNSKRFLFLHRWFKNGKKYSRIITSDINGTDLYELLKEGMVSHCYWKDEKQIIVYAHTNKYGDSYVLLKDKTDKKIQKWKDLKRDGHPSYNDKKKLYVTDTYPDKCRISHLYVMNENTAKEIGSIYNSFKFDNLNRCDMHPKWNREGTKICIDGAPNGRREIFVIEVNHFKK